MSIQHRATPEQWAKQESWANGPTSSCIVELRDRVEALEAAALGRHGESADSAAALSLADRVARTIFSTPDSFKDEARAAIREVAAWLRSEYPAAAAPGTAWANLIEEEANR